MTARSCCNSIEVVRSDRALRAISDPVHQIGRWATVTVDEPRDGRLLTANLFSELAVGDAVLAEIVCERHAEVYTTTVYSSARAYSTPALQTFNGTSQNRKVNIEDTLRQAMNAKGWKQQQLADAVGVEQPTVQRWLAGTRKPDAAAIVRLASALDIEPFDLVDLEEMRQLGLAPATASSPAGAEIVNIFSAMGKRDREALLDMSRTLQRRANED